MENRNRIKSKSVGGVRIFEISGCLEGEFGRSGDAAIERTMKGHIRKNVLFNLRHLKKVDAEAVAGIIKNLRNTIKCALVTENPEVIECFKRLDESNRLAFLHDEKEAIHFFAQEFVSVNDGPSFTHERRQFIRLQTALPVDFTIATEKGENVCLTAVVTNLSESGLYAEFIQAQAEQWAKDRFNPYDLNLIEVGLSLNVHVQIKGRGKLIHGSVQEGGLGLEFYEFPQGHRAMLREWVAEHCAKAIKEAGKET